MNKKAIAALLIIIAVFALLYFIPFPGNADFALNGSIRSAEGDVITPCSVKFSGHELRFLFKDNKLSGTLHLTENSQNNTFDVSAEIHAIPEEDPNGNLNYISTLRYDKELNRYVSLYVYFTDDRTTCLVVDNGTIYFASSLEEAQADQIFDQIAKFAQLAK